MERARGGVPSVGVGKRRVLRGLWRRLVGVGIIGPGLLGAPAFIMVILLAALYWGTGQSSTNAAFALRPPLPCAGASVVRPRLPPVGRAQHLCMTTVQLFPTCSAHRLLSQGRSFQSARLRPFVLDRNIRHFLWYGGVAGDGLRSVGADGELPIQERMLYPAHRPPFTGRSL